MPTKLAPEQLLAAADSLLVKQHGQRTWHRHGDGVELLVQMILSQETNWTNADLAYQRLRHRLPAWDEVAGARAGVIEGLIRVAGLARGKAEAIANALRTIRSERGGIDLEFLPSMPLEEARRWLMRFKGVGPKTADCVLLFAFNMPTFPVDTHVHRVALRLGLAGRGSTVSEVHDIMMSLIPPDRRYAMHLLLIEHGRKICTFSRPRCGECRLLKICPYGQRQFKVPDRPTRRPTKRKK